MPVERDSYIFRWLLGSYLVVAAAILITCYLEDAKLYLDLPVPDIFGTKLPVTNISGN